MHYYSVHALYCAAELVRYDSAVLASRREPMPSELTLQHLGRIDFSLVIMAMLRDADVAMPHAPSGAARQRDVRLPSTSYRGVLSGFTKNSGQLTGGITAGRRPHDVVVVVAISYLAHQKIRAAITDELATHGSEAAPSVVTVAKSAPTILCQCQFSYVIKFEHRRWRRGLRIKSGWHTRVRDDAHGTGHLTTAPA